MGRTSLLQNSITWRPTDEKEFMWFVGVFEGEGTICLSARSSVQLRIAMTDKDVIARIRNVVGLGTVYAPWKSQRADRKPSWLWNMYRKAEVAAVLPWMLPHLGERRRARALEAVQHMKRSSLRVVAVCGTISGYAAHRRKSEPTCEQCRKIWRDTARASRWYKAEYNKKVASDG